MQWYPLALRHYQDVLSLLERFIRRSQLQAGIGAAEMLPVSPSPRLSVRLDPDAVYQYLTERSQEPPVAQSSEETVTVSKSGSVTPAELQASPTPSLTLLAGDASVAQDSSSPLAPSLGGEDRWLRDYDPQSDSTLPEGLILTRVDVAGMRRALLARSCSSFLMMRYLIGRKVGHPSVSPQH